MKILVVEDDAELRLGLHDLLVLHGFEVIVAANGGEGMQCAGQHLPDLIVCDINMPVMDGYQVVRALRENPATDHIPVIFLSARADRTDVRTGMDLGAEDYITKPFAEKELMQSISTRLERRKAEQSRLQRGLNTLREDLRNSLSHELLTPLNGILGFASLLEENAFTITREEIIECSQMIKQSGERQHELVKKVLAYAELELLQKNEEVVNGTISFFLPQALIEKSARQVAERMSRLEDLTIVPGEAVLGIDADYFERLVRELVENACKFSAKGRPIAVREALVGNEFVFAVADHGWGMTAEQIAAIAPYTQFDRKKHEQQGLGLGLATVRRIVELWDGTWNIESRPGAGTTVTVRFPISGENPVDSGGS